MAKIREQVIVESQTQIHINQDVVVNGKNQTFWFADRSEGFPFAVVNMSMEQWKADPLVQKYPRTRCWVIAK